MIQVAKNQYAPDYAVHPGEILEETLQARSLGKGELALRSGLSQKHISQIINGKAPITPETAIKLERILDVKAGLWLRLENEYQLFLQKILENEVLVKQASWVKRFPIKELTERGYLPAAKKTEELAAALLNFFNVGSIEAWQRQYKHLEACFRKAGIKKQSMEAVAAWLKIGENKAKDIATKPFDKQAFEHALKAIRAMTKGKPEHFVPALGQVCAECGVAVIFEKELHGTGLCGATFWHSREKAILMLSLRYKSDDHLWFTFFHEAGHILLHGRHATIVDCDGCTPTTIEAQADTFAANYLIPQKKYDDFILTTPRITETAIRSFATVLNIAPGIVVGRLQKDRRIEFKWHNILKRRFILPVR